MTKLIKEITGSSLGIKTGGNKMTKDVLKRRLVYCASIEACPHKNNWLCWLISWCDHQYLNLKSVKL